MHAKGTRPIFAAALLSASLANAAAADEARLPSTSDEARTAAGERIRAIQRSGAPPLAWLRDAAATIKTTTDEVRAAYPMARKHDCGGVLSSERVAAAALPSSTDEARAAVGLRLSSQALAYAC